MMFEEMLGTAEHSANLLDEDTAGDVKRGPQRSEDIAAYALSPVFCIAWRDQ
jgi:hypothetical protein